MTDARLQTMIREALASNDPMLGYKAFLESQRQGLNRIDVCVNKYSFSEKEFFIPHAHHVYEELEIVIEEFNPKTLYFDIGYDFLTVASRRFCDTPFCREVSFYYCFVLLNGTFVRTHSSVYDTGPMLDDKDITDNLERIILAKLNEMSRDIDFAAMQKRLYLEGLQKYFESVVNQTAQAQANLSSLQELCGEIFLRLQGEKK